MFMRQIYDPSLAHYSYLIGCQRTGEAVVIDPQRDIDRYRTLAHENDLRVTAVADTHIHADYLSGALEFSADPDVTLYLSAEGGDDWQYEWAKGLPTVQFVRDGDAFRIGKIELRVTNTPGHTPGVLSLEFTVHDAGEPHKAFTFGGVGLNFSGVERTGAYIDSVRRLMQLEGIEVNVPNHAAMGRVFERAAQLQSREPGEPHPFVAPVGFRSWLETLLDNAKKKLAEEMAR